MLLSVLSANKPPYRVRKYADGWHVQKWIVKDGFEVLSFVGSFTHWPVAMAIVSADAGPDTYPLFRDALDGCP